MLDISVNVDVKKTTYPILFTNNTCVQCAAVGTLKFVNIFGRPSSQEIHPLERIQCMKCGAKYGIHWEADNDGTLHPNPVDYDASLMFSNMLNHSKIKRQGNKKLLT